MKEEPLTVLADFFARFYHEEPNDVVASTRALRMSAEHFEYRWEIAESFRYALRAELRPGTLRNLIRQHANRLCRDDEQAKDFLKETYLSNSFDTAIDPSNFEDT